MRKSGGRVAAVDLLVLPPGFGKFFDRRVFSGQQVSGCSVGVFAEIHGTHGMGNQPEYSFQVQRSFHRHVHKLRCCVQGDEARRVC